MQLKLRRTLWGFQWDCDVCPASEPSDGSFCADSGDRCFYGDTKCRCDDNSWSCATCPATEPNDGAKCSPEYIHCGYASGYCVCDPGNGNQDDTWDCN